MVSKCFYSLAHTNTNYDCSQERSAMRMETIYRLKHLLVIWIWGFTTGNHTTIASNLNLPTFSFVVTRCPPGTSTSFLASGRHPLLSTTMNPHFPTLKNFTTQLIPPLLATSPGNHLAFSTMEISQHSTFRHGCKQNTTSGFEIPEPLSKICCQTPILNLISIMHPFKSAMLVFIVFEISCLQYGPGSRQWVLSFSLTRRQLIKSATLLGHHCWGSRNSWLRFLSHYSRQW